MTEIKYLKKKKKKKRVKSVNHVYCLSEREQITVVQKYEASILINKAHREP